MTAAPSSNQPESEVPHLSLVQDVAEETVAPAVSFSYSVEPFNAERYSEGLVASIIGRLVTDASGEYGLKMGGKSGIDLDVERRNQRRKFATRIFHEFGMLRGAVETLDEAENVPELKLIGNDFATNHFDPAERAIADLDRSERNKLIERRFKHPVLRAANSWALISGESNENMRTDAILVTRAAALILERIGEAEYPDPDDLEL